MSEGAEGQQPFRKEQDIRPEYKQEIVQYQNGPLALCLTGERGAKLDFALHKYSPTRPMREAIVSTKSGNDYYILTNGGRTYVINTRESSEQGKLVAAYKEFPADLPPIEFGKPWTIPGFYTTSDVESVLLKYKIGDIGERKINEPNPFDEYKSRFTKPAS
jgi:hypothetical protein